MLLVRFFFLKKGHQVGDFFWHMDGKGGDVLSIKRSFLDQKGKST